MPNTNPEAARICKLLNCNIPKKWDGKVAILELKDADFQWRQMEWIGWYFEFKAKKVLTSKFGKAPGPRYGSTEFDFKGENVWDFKAHVSNSSSHPWSIINDKEAIDLCVNEYGGVGIVIATGRAELDYDGSFKNWHDHLKGGKSDYEKERITRGAPSRKRKTAFTIDNLVAFWLDPESIKIGFREKWIGHFQEGMRNANGSPRRGKYMLNIEAAARHVRIV